jgi:hypothetical protein
MFCKSQGTCDVDPGNDYIRVRGRKHGPCTGSPNSQSPKKTRRVKSKVMSMLIIFLNIKEIATKEFVLVGQRLNSASYCDG